MIGSQDTWVLMPTVDLYDTLMMLAAVLAAKDMYNRSEERIKEFNEKYGDFTTPIIADQDWYNQEFGGKIHRYIDDMYRRGGDPLRNAQDRASMMMMINRLPYGDYAKIRTSAENAREYLKEQAKLEAAGLYNPLLEKYAGKGMDTFSTLGGDGIWGRMSPTRITDMATFGNPYFEGMKPNVHSASKNGISYTIEEINENDLKAIADAHFNELVSTPQGQLMYKYYQDIAKTTGGDARDMFNNAVVDGQRRRIYQKDNYDDQWATHLRIAQGWESNKLARDKFNWDKAMDLLQLGIDENGNPLPSAGGYGLGGLKTLARGAADQLAITQDKQRAEYTDQVKAEIDANKKQTDSAYNKMSPGFKLIANKYKKYIEVLSDKSSSKDKTVEAANFIAKWQGNSNKEFLEWKLQYEKSLQNKNLQYYNQLTGANKFGEEQDLRITLSNAHDIFQKANVVPNLTTSQKSALNTALNLVESDNGLTGTVTPDTEYSPVTEARFTGNRMYRSNSFISKINRIIKNKKYTVSDEDVSGRNYASAASRSGVRYDIIQQTGTFRGEEFDLLLGNISDESLKEYGIERVGDNGYKIPISTRFSKGNQSWADVNTESHRKNKSVSEEAAIEQARSLLRKYGR